MNKLLITGGTGNVGLEVIKALEKIEHSWEVYAGVRDLEKDKVFLENYAVRCVSFDFMDASTYSNDLQNYHTLFLLRPPQISDVKKYFEPIIDCAKKVGIKHIIFLSVLSPEEKSFIFIILLC
jgi:uncharacterized protein YbjT (DUF2867 family)